MKKIKVITCFHCLSKILVQKSPRNTSIPNVRPAVGAAAPKRKHHNISQGVLITQEFISLLCTGSDFVSV